VIGSAAIFEDRRDAGRRLAEAARLGFRHALVPPGCGGEAGDGTPAGMQVTEVGDLRSALQAAARVAAGPGDR